MNKKMNKATHQVFLSDWVIFCFLFFPLLETKFVSLYIPEFYIPLFLLWIGAVFFSRFTYRVSLSLASVYLLFTLLFLFLDDVFSANRLAIWFYLFFFFGFMQYCLGHLVLFRKSDDGSIKTSFARCMYEIIYISRNLYFATSSLLIAGIYYQLLTQIQYFYWYYVFDKLKRYLFAVGLFELTGLAILATVFVLLHKRMNIRLLFILLLLSTLFMNSLLFFVKTRDIVIVGDDPKISEIKRHNQYLLLFGHNFRRWPNEYSKVIINDQKQEVAFWNSDVIIIQDSSVDDSSWVQVTNALDLSGEKISLNNLLDGN